MSNPRFDFRLVSAVFAMAFMSACAPQSSTAAAAPQPVAEPRISSGPPPAPLVRGLPDFTGLVAAVGPAVVNVKVVERASNTRASGSSPFGGADDPFGDFFRRFGIPRDSIPNVPRNAPPRQGEGSGFFVTSDGYLLTNAHVVDNASKITITLTDRREFAAKVIGIDEATDVAVLKVDGSNLPTVRLGDPAKLRAGEWVVAIGSPFGFENSATAGIVSATARPVPNASSQTNYVNFIQSDVAVNPGNSGGPLFNLSGEVVGINSQIISNTGSYAGLSFSIPIDIANNVREQLVKNGRVSRGRIGVSIQPVTAALAESYGLDRPRGALVSSVTAGGPAEKAGIKPEDIILKVNGTTVENSSEVPPLIAAVKPGATAQIEVWRDRGSRRLSAVVEELQESGRLARAERGSGGDAASSVDKLGLSVRELTAQEKQQLGTSGSVVVEDAEGAAAEANIQSGDVILRANGARVNTVEELRNAVKGGGLARLMIQRGEGQIIVTVRPD
jgi:serine protease Do